MYTQVALAVAGIYAFLSSIDFVRVCSFIAQAVLGSYVHGLRPCAVTACSAYATSTLYEFLTTAVSSCSLNGKQLGLIWTSHVVQRFIVCPLLATRFSHI